MIHSKEQAFNNRHIFRRPKWDNLTPEERWALYDLKLNKDIVIKAADNGMQFVSYNKKTIFWKASANSKIQNSTNQ